MVNKSNRMKKYNYNSNSDSESDADPDPAGKGRRGLSKKSSMENVLSSINGGVMKKIWEVKENRGKQGDMRFNKETELYAYRRSYGRSEYDQNTEFDDENDNGNNGQRSMKATIFSWLIDSNTLQEGASVFLSADNNNNTLFKKGIFKRDGILCLCCNKIFTASGFTFHGGRRNSNNNKPYQSIFTIRKRISLLSFMVQAWNNPEESERRRFNRIESESTNAACDPYDDACMICADGGNLMCCEQCNSTYHQACMAMEEVPVGSWYCPYCVCKFCGDPVRQNDYLLECPQCEKKYHWECHQKRELTEIDMNSIPCAPFCGQSCKEVQEKLEKTMVGKKNELDEGFSWTLLHRTDDDTTIYLHDTYERTVCHSKLALALRLMEDCFEPIVDRHTRIDLISSIVYNNGANFNRIQFRGFYTAVLEKDEEIISAASLRIHGTKLAEMPFIATGNNHRCKGMCKKLMVGIESALCYLNVQYLVIPSVSERIGSWIEKYGFELLEPKMEKEIMCHNTLMFHDSIRLQKSLAPSRFLGSDRKCKRDTSTKRKPKRDHPRNCVSIRKQDMKISVLDMKLEQPVKRNKKPWINNHDRLSCGFN